MAPISVPADLHILLSTSHPASAPRPLPRHTLPPEETERIQLCSVGPLFSMQDGVLKDKLGFGLFPEVLEGVKEVRGPDRNDFHLSWHLSGVVGTRHYQSPYERSQNFIS